MIISECTLLCGEETYNDMEDFGEAKEDWFKTFLKLPRNEKLKLDQHFRHCETVDGDHGRIEIRRYYQSDDLAWFEDMDKWEGLRSVGVVESVRKIGDEVTT
ncbi:MAG: hypothetical protein HOH33_06765, partial [Verrucomicrobia bacterium]|nr:hypothetical protein [Verrucomicrobiota bacterium]